MKIRTPVLHNLIILYALLLFDYFFFQMVNCAIVRWTNVNGAHFRLAQTNSTRLAGYM